MMFGSVTKHTSGSVDMSIALTVCNGTQKPLHSVKCTVWMTISKHGPFRFENADEEAVTVTKKRYIDVPKKFWRALRTRRDVNRDAQWYQQDESTQHTSNIVMKWLDHQFPNRLIRGRREPE